MVIAGSGSTRHYRHFRGNEMEEPKNLTDAYCLPGWFIVGTREMKGVTAPRLQIDTTSHSSPTSV